LIGWQVSTHTVPPDKLEEQKSSAEEALRIGLVNRLVPPGEEVAAACEWANALAAFPQDTMLADREAALRGFGLPLEDAIALERRLGWATAPTGQRGAARFAAGEGRSGARLSRNSGD
jgi:enoyl-CoA hydratase